MERVTEDMSRIDAAVIGTVFTDIKGFSAEPYNPLGRNPGKIELFQGGVGRNVAENMASLGLNILFVSSVDEGMLGEGVLARLASLRTDSTCGVDTAYVKQVPSQGMGIWMLINDQNGEQAGSLSQMPDPAYTGEVLEEAGDEIVAGAEHVVLEVDVSAEITRKTLELARKYHKKVYALPANMDVILRMPHALSQVECFICNDIEAGQLFDRQFFGLEPDRVAVLLEEGMKKYQIPSMVVTMGEKGAVYCDARTGMSGYVPAMKVDAVDCSGAGDAFFSGSAAALMRGVPLEKAVQCGTRLAALTIQSASCTCETEFIRNAQIL